MWGTKYSIRWLYVCFGEFRIKCGQVTSETIKHEHSPAPEGCGHTGGVVLGVRLWGEPRAQFGYARSHSNMLCMLQATGAGHTTTWYNDVGHWRGAMILSVFFSAQQAVASVVVGKFRQRPFFGSRAALIPTFTRGFGSHGKDRP